RAGPAGRAPAASRAGGPRRRHAAVGTERAAHPAPAARAGVRARHASDLPGRLTAVPVHLITDPDDERLGDYRALTDLELRTRWEPPHGLFIAEGELVLRRALRAGYRPRSYLIDAKRVDQLADLAGDAPVYAATPDVLTRT